MNQSNKILEILEIEEILNKNFKKHKIKFDSGFGSSQFDTHTRVGIINAGIQDDGLIIINYADYFYETFEDEELYNELSVLIKNLVSHELTHLQQMKKITLKHKNNYKISEILNKLTKDPNNRFKYLSSKQEMMAFAVECVEEYRSNGYSDKEILKKMKSPWGEVESDIFWMYFDYFDYRGNWMSGKDKMEMKGILDRFLKYMYQYIEKDV